MTWRRTTAPLALLLACSGGGPATPDAGPAIDGGTDGGTLFDMPEPPAPPELPVFTPCPGGWREVPGTDGDPTTCDPWPDTGPAACNADEAHFPGTPGCVRVGPACPTGDWPEDLPTDVPIVYVRPGDPGTGTGTIGDPFGRIADATTGAATGTIIALSKGAHEAPSVLRTGLTLWGACVAGTSVEAATAGTAVVFVNGAPDLDTEIHNLRIVSDVRVGIYTWRALRLQSVVIERAWALGILASSSGDVIARDVIVRDVQTSAGSTDSGVGVFGTARADLERVIVEGCNGPGVLASGTVNLRDVVVRDTIDTTMAPGRGVYAYSGATIEADRLVVERARSSGLHGLGAGTLLVIRDSVVSDTQAVLPAGTRGAGMQLLSGASADLTRVVFQRNRMFGIVADGEDTPGGTLTIAHVLVRDTDGMDVDGTFGRGLNLEQGVIMTGDHLLVQRSRELGLLVYDQAQVTFADLTIEDTLGDQSDGSNGMGLNVEWSSTAQLSRVAIRRCRTAGLVAAYDAVITVSDLEVRDIAGQLLDEQYGHGVASLEGSTIDITRGLIVTNREIGAGAFRGAALVAEDLVVSGILPTDCFPATCPELGWGVGAGAYDPQSTLDLTRFRVTDNALGGVQVATGGVADLHDGEISTNPIGANIQTEGFELDRLLDRVRFLGNGTDLDSRTQPVPQPPGF